MEAWLSVGVGLFLWLFQPRLLQWLSSRLFHTHFDDFVDADGNVVSYLQQPAFWMDLGPALFGLALILDGIVLGLARRNRALMRIAFLLTVLTTIYNGGYVIYSQFNNLGFAPLSFLAALFGVYIAYTQWLWMAEAALPSKAKAAAAHP